MIVFFRLKKNRVAIRAVVFLMIITTNAFAGNSFSQNISLKAVNSPIASICRQIEKMSGYSFVYDKNTLKGAAPVTIEIVNKPLRAALDQLLKGLPLSYTIRENRYIVLYAQKLAAKETEGPVQQQIGGRVIDSVGIPIAGASVRIAGTKFGTITGSNGTFTISAAVGQEIEISYVGYITQKLKITGDRDITVTLTMAPSELNQIVVTALGIKRSVKSLTYNVQELSGQEVTRNKDANFVNSLAGKVAGVTINSSSAGIGGATRVVMRGTKSINPGADNNALYVIDGMPMPNVNGGTASTGPFTGAVSSEGISSINPEDIESISVLTGPSAAALYGSGATNGVVIVTTRKGAVHKMRASLAHSSDFYKPFAMPQFQQRYGQSTSGAFDGWGAKLSSPSAYDPKDFFQTGTNIFNTVSLSGGTEKSQTFFSVGANNANGIIPNNDFNRYNFYLRHTVNFSDRLSADFNAMYAKINDRNMVAQGQYSNPLLGVYLFPPGEDFSKYEIYKRYDPSRKVDVQFWPFGNQGLAIENPYWVVYNEPFTDKVDRYMLSGTIKYKAFDWMDITGRARVDNSNTVSEVKRAASTDGILASQFGYYTINKTNAKNTYADLIASIHQDFSPAIGFSANIGGSFLNDQWDALGAGGKLQRLANFYSASENTTDPPTQRFYHRQEQAVFATAEFNYKKWLYLNATGRQEWSSLLAGADKRHYFYPSVGLSGVLTDALPISGNTLSFAKVRLSYAQVGKAPAIYGVTNPVYSILNNAFRPAPFPTFQAEQTKSFEAGIDLRLFDNRLSLSATLYKSNTTNQLMDQKISGAQYTDFYYNAGNVENKGIEASLGYRFNKTAFKWSTQFVFSLNKNKIIRLSEGYQNPVTGEVYGQDSIKMGVMGDLQNILVSGGNMSDLYVTQVLKEDNIGHLWVDPATNNIAKTQISPRYIGHTTPDYNLSWSNNISFKQFDLSFLVDARVGGIGISYTQAVMDAFGVSKKSADDRDAGGVNIYGQRYPFVQTFYQVIGAASGASVGPAAYYVYSATNVRLREAALGYTFPGGWLGNWCKELKIAVTGRNLFMFYNKAPFDPESTSSTGTYNQGIDFFRQPSYRSFGFSIKAGF